jgi:hypothetical protein
MKKSYSSELVPNVLKNEIPVFQLSPRKATVDRILAFSAAYWTTPMGNNAPIELIMN